MSNLKIEDVLLKETVFLNETSFKDKNEVFQYLTEKLFKKNFIKDKEEFMTALFERESLGSTYMGNSIALPHCKSETVNRSVICFCRCTKPLKYESYNEVGDVKYIFLLAINKKDGNDRYLRILATLARYLAHEEIVERLPTIESYEELVDCFKKFGSEQGGNTK